MLAMLYPSEHISYNVGTHSRTSLDNIDPISDPISDVIYRYRNTHNVRYNMYTYVFLYLLEFI
jgi:hypothetical protein